MTRPVHEKLGRQGAQVTGASNALRRGLAGRLGLAGSLGPKGYAMLHCIRLRTRHLGYLSLIHRIRLRT